MSTTSFEALMADPVQWWHAFLAKGNPMVRDWPLMNPYHMLATVVGYFALIFVLVQFTKRREKPYSMKFLAIVHNLHLVVLSAYMMYGLVYEAWFVLGYKLWGNPIVADTTKAYGLARMVWIYYLSKVPEFFDTVLMALKKNYRQITFLHLYHHSTIFMVWWGVTYFAPGGEAYFSAALNSFIHVIMYAYYLWRVLVGGLPAGTKPTWRNPEYHRQTITNMQLTQFFIMMCQSIYDILNPIDGFPIEAIWVLFFYMISMFILFGNFYVQQYANKKAKKAAAAAAGAAKKDE